MTLPVNYTTTVPASRTVGEMQAALAKRGAAAVAITYGPGGNPAGMTFMLRGSHFQLPVDVDAMHRLLRRETSGKRAERAHAERVAWRVVKDWLNAQLSLVDAGMTGLDEVMLPYLVVGPDRLLRDDWRDRKALTVGADA